MLKMRSFELVVPAYNESRNLKILIGQTIEAAKQRGFGKDSFQLIVVNNGSVDDSNVVLTQLAGGALGEWFRVVLVPKNQGYGHGLWQGLQNTNAEIIGWSHADLQCDPANAFKAYEILRAESESCLVKGTRSGRDSKDIFVSRVFELFAFLILGVRVHEMNAQPKVFPRELINEFQNPPKTFAFDLYALYKAQKSGYQIMNIPVSFPPRIHGVSSWASHFILRYRTIIGIIKYMFHLARTEGRIW
jgi:glycosyltransferase involved in cell wall biosynthesis